MTHEAVATTTHSSGSAMLPAVVSVLLALIWGAYTALVLYEIMSTPLPTL